MLKLIILLFFIVFLDACKSDEVRPGEVEAVLTGYQDDTLYNPCAGWIFDFGSNQRPARAVPENFRNQKGIKVWVKFESDTTRAKIYGCNFIKIESLRKRR
jgi:hypothetical protein